MKSSTKKAYKYNAEGTPVAKEEADETPEFKSGGAAKGKKKKMHHEKVHGKAPKHRLDRKPRSAGGRNPYSSAESATGAASNDEEGKKEVTGPGAETSLAIYKKGGKVK